MIASRSVRGAVVVTVALVAARAFASDLDALKDTTPKERATVQTMMMKEKLGLTDGEVPQVAAINEKYAQQMDPVIKGSQGMLMKMRAMKQVEQQKEGELQKVLTPEQFQKFLAAKGEMRDQLMDRIKQQRGAKTP